MAKIWHLYMIRCGDNTLYTGITTDVKRRLSEHQAQSKKCAKYLRGKLPLHLVYQSAVGTRQDASKLESQIKKMSKQEKEALIINFKKNCFKLLR